jgi:hypothetical protein
MYQSVGQIDHVGLTGYGYEGTTAPSYIDNLQGRRVIPNGSLADLTDLDDDGDVDLDDHALLQTCMTTPPAGIQPGCEDADFNLDALIDAGDSAE